MKLYLDALLQQAMTEKLEELDREEAKLRHPSSQTNTEEDQ